MNKLYKNKKGQIIVMMGVLLSISLILIAAISSELSNIRMVLPEQRTTSLIDDFRDVKKVFGLVLNYNLVDAEVNATALAEEKYNLSWPNAWYSYYVGNIKDLPDAFEKTVREVSIIELSKGNVFDAELVEYYPTTEYSTIYTVVVNLTLGNGMERITERVGYNIICNSYLTYVFR
ncbi:MAG TPA: hypothetical protein ENG74_03960 [Thermoplasmatales archaeon]|nr:hypothetical protein [Thermoplasmatales archaeon]